jgi:hypothetical protein
VSESDVNDLFGTDVPSAPTAKKGPAKKPAAKKAAPKAPAKAAPAEVSVEVPAIPAPAEAAMPVAEPTPVVETQHIQKSALRPGWKTILVDESEGEANFVFVGVNGKHYQIQRGVEVDVPPNVIEVLSHAVATRLVSVVNPVTGAREMVQRSFLRYPFRVTRG